MVERVKLKVLPVVKAYPEPSATYGTTVCVAGVTIPEGRWVRLYPIRFTELPEQQRFKKYQVFEATAVKSEKDSRPESYRIDEETIQILGDPIGTGDGWSERKRLLENAPVVSFCELQRMQKRDRTSLGMIKVREVTHFRTVPADEEKYQRAERKYEFAATADLFNESSLRVEALSFKYQYWFSCTHDRCNGHKCSIIDWEAYELHRKMRARWGEDGAFEKVKQMYVDTICGPNKETHFFMGNMQAHPRSFLVLGAFYPSRNDSPTFFELGEGRRLQNAPAQDAERESDQLSFPEPDEGE